MSEVELLGFFSQTAERPRYVEASGTPSLAMPVFLQDEWPIWRIAMSESFSVDPTVIRDTWTLIDVLHANIHLDMQNELTRRASKS